MSLLSFRSERSVKGFIPAIVCGLVWAIAISPTLPVQAKSPQPQQSHQIIAGYTPNESRDEAIDRFADWVFYRVNPQLEGYKLQPADSAYIQEWLVIREAVDREMIQTPGDCAGDRFWDLRDYGPGAAVKSGSLDRIANAIWTYRDPAGYRSRDDRDGRQQKALRRSIDREHFCY